MELRVDEVVPERIAGAHGHPAVAGGIPRETNTRRELQPVVLHSRVAIGKAGITWIQEPGRRVRVLCGALAGEVPIDAEVVDGAVANLLRKAGFPAQAIVDGRLRRQPPCVGGV